MIDAVMFVTSGKIAERRVTINEHGAELDREDWGGSPIVTEGLASSD